MKLVKISAVAAVALAFASCSDGSKTVELGKDATMADSIGYYLGQMIEAQHVQYAEMADSTMKSKESLDAYAEGFYKGLELLKTDNEAYNKGLMDGVTAHMQIIAANKEFGTDLTVGAVKSGFNAAKAKPVNQTEMQELNNKLMDLTNRLSAQNLKKKSDEAKKTADAAAKKAGYTAKNGVNYKVVKEGTGANLTSGQNIKANLTIADKNGKEILPKMEGVNQTVGNTPFSPLFEKALPMLKVGSSYMFMASAYDVFGEQMPPQVNAEEPIVITVEVVGIEETPATEASAATTATTPAN